MMNKYLTVIITLECYSDELNCIFKNVFPLSFNIGNIKEALLKEKL